LLLGSEAIAMLGRELVAVVTERLAQATDGLTRGEGTVLARESGPSQDRRERQGVVRHDWT
jgi:hypothetical protein